VSRLEREKSGGGVLPVTRLLLGGCSRSGTTFLQELLANHSRILTFPETGVFLKALGMRGTVLPWARLGLTLGKERGALGKLLDQVGQLFPDPPSLPPRRFLQQRSFPEVAGFFDELAARAGKDIWLEKTPRHVLHAARIRRLVPGSLFIHILREGRDVVASIVDRARRFPEEFRRQADPGYGIRQWNRSLRATERAMREPGHVVVLYESLSTEPEATLKALCGAIGIAFEEGMLHRREERTFVAEKEGWKRTLSGPIRPAPSKFETVFDTSERARVNEGLHRGFFDRVKEKLAGTPGGIWISG
jgi:hypothetical protein